MYARFTALTLLTACILAGCGQGDTETDPAPASEVLYFEQIGYGQRGALSDSVELVIRSPEEWAVYRDSLIPTAPFDSVDFAQTVIMLVALPQPTSGYSIEFVTVEDFDSVAVAEYVVSAPADDCLTAFAKSVPFSAIMVRRTEKPVRFERETEEYRCTGRR